MVQQETYLNIKIIITPFLESGIEARIEFVTSTFLNLQICQYPLSNNIQALSLTKKLLPNRIKVQWLEIA